MSFLTGTVSEVIYQMPAAGASYNNSITANTILSGNTASNPPFAIPAQIWQPSYVTGRSIVIMAGGIYSTTATPTLAFKVGLDATQGTFGTALATTGTFTTSGTQANGAWQAEVWITFTQVGTTGNTYSFFSTGQFTYGPANNTATTAATAIMIGAPSSGGPPATPTLQTVVPATTTYLELAATWGAASTSNMITCTQFLVCGMN